VPIYQCFRNQKSILTTQSDNILLVGAWVQGRYIPPYSQKVGTIFLDRCRTFKIAQKSKKVFGIYNNCKPYIYKSQLASRTNEKARRKRQIIAKLLKNVEKRAKNGKRTQIDKSSRTTRT